MRGGGGGGRQTKISLAQRSSISAGMAAGLTRREVAIAAGVSDGTVTNVSQSPDGRALIKRLAEKYERQLERLYCQTLEETAKDLRKPIAQVRQHARAEVLRMITMADQANAGVLGDGPPGEGEERFTLRELMISYHRGTAGEVQWVETAGASGGDTA